MYELYTSYLTPASVLIPLVIGLCYYSVLGTSYRFLIAYLSFSVLASILGIVFAYVFHNNLIVNRIYTIGEFILLSGFYYHQFSSLTLRKCILIMMIAFTALCIYLMVIFAHVSRFDDYSTSTESLLVIFLSLALTVSHNNSSLARKWQSESINWFNTGILLYFSGALFIFLTFNYMWSLPLLRHIAWVIHDTLLLLLSVIFTIGFYKVKKEQESISRSQSV
jgi:hypothetical protein